MQLRIARLTSLPFSALVVAAVIACSSEPTGDDDGGGSAGEAGGESTPTAGTGGQDEEPSAGGTGGDAGASNGSGGASAGEAGGSGETGGAGATGGAGMGGAGGDVACAFTDGSCPTPCHEVPIVTGCGDDQEQARLCTAEPPANTTSCGVRLSDEQVFYVDATYDTTELVVPNPFAATADFRACTQAEVDASDCREHADETAEASARFVLQNTSTEDRWVLVEGDPCTPFDLKKDGASLVLESGVACAESACNAIAADAFQTETWERVAAGASVTLTWDGSELATYQTIDVCEPGETETGEEREQPGDGRCVDVERRAAAPGAYSITLGVRSTDPSLDDEAECEAERCDVLVDLVGVAPIYEACRTTGGDTLSLAFTLPEAGEAVVDVTLE